LASGGQSSSFPPRVVAPGFCLVFRATLRTNVDSR
jgi:hypothetical protein